MKAVLITSSILIVLAAALRPVLRGRIDPRVQYALWLAAVLRLLIPVNFADSAYSALALLERADRGQDIVETIGQTTVPIPGISYEDAYDQALREYHQDRPAATSFTDLAEVERRAQEIQAKSPTLADLAAKYARPVWLGGAAMMGLWFLLVNLRLRRRLRWALPVEADCPLPVRVTPELPSPCLCGVVRPTIYVTPAALETPDRLRHVLAHELTHYRHRDHWWALVRCLCLCLYWFDPLVWWAAALSRQDCELACDEGAIRRLGEGERLPYGRTLVDMIAAGRTSLLQTATTMTGGKRRVRERIKLIARRPKTVAAAALALAIVLVLAVGCTFTGAPENPAGPEESQQPVESPPLGHTLSAATADNLQKRLMDVPEELCPTVKAAASETKQAVNDIALVSYWLDEPIEWIDEQNYWLLDVHREERRFIDAHGWADDNDDQIREVIAQDEEFYYVIERPVDRRFRLEDSEPFTAAYQAIHAYAVEQVLAAEGVEPFDPDNNPVPAQQAIQAVVDRLMAEPSLKLAFYPDGKPYNDEGFSFEYSTVPSQDFNAFYLSDLSTYFQWEYAPYSTAEGSDALRVTSADGTVSLFLSKGSYLVLVEQDGETICYKGQYRYGDGNPPSSAYDFLYLWFVEVELASLRAAFSVVDNNGQSHEDIAREWAENYEGALTKVSPGNPYACTSMEIIDVYLPDWTDYEYLEEFAQARGFSAEDLGKTWFGFGYRTVFVPVDDRVFWAGNTQNYEDPGAPEGALAYSRVGYMYLTDEGWTCDGVGTGW